MFYAMFHILFCVPCSVPCSIPCYILCSMFCPMFCSVSMFRTVFHVVYHVLFCGPCSVLCSVFCAMFHALYCVPCSVPHCLLLSGAIRELSGEQGSVRLPGESPARHDHSTCHPAGQGEGQERVILSICTETVITNLARRMTYPHVHGLNVHSQSTRVYLDGKLSCLELCMDFFCLPHQSSN